MTVGYWSPLPPAATGVADYSAALLPFLEKLGPIRANKSGDVNVYHVGNNALHREIYQRALAQPGLVVLHDAVLQHFFLGSLTQHDYVEEFVFNYGEWSRAMAEELWKERSRSGADARYFSRPMVKRIAASARAVIVHNPAAAQIVREHAPDARIFEIPHLLIPPPPIDTVEVLRLRQRLGITGRTLLLGTFGHQRETKRLGVLLRAFHRAITAGADAKLLVSGEFVSSIYEEAMSPLLDHPRVVRLPYLPEPEFWKHLAATDLCVNLRYPSAAESSGVAIRMMAIGRAVAFTTDLAVSRFPEDACLRIDAGPAEETMLAGYIAWLAEHPEAARSIGDNAARYVAKEHAPDRVATLYWNAIRSS